MLRNRVFIGAILTLGYLSMALPLLRADEIVYDSGNRRDPFVVLPAEEIGVSATSTSGLKLEGIIYDPGSRSMVVLNGKTYLAGDTVGEATVLKIMTDHVVISQAGEEKTLWIRDSENPS